MLLSEERQLVGGVGLVESNDLGDRARLIVAGGAAGEVSLEARFVFVEHDCHLVGAARYRGGGGHIGRVDDDRAGHPGESESRLDELVGLRAVPEVVTAGYAEPRPSEAVDIAE